MHASRTSRCSFAPSSRRGLVRREQDRDGELEHGGDSVEASVEAISRRFTPAGNADRPSADSRDLEDADVLSVDFSPRSVATGVSSAVCFKIYD